MREGSSWKDTFGKTKHKGNLCYLSQIEKKRIKTGMERSALKGIGGEGGNKATSTTSPSTIPGKGVHERKSW